MPRKTVSLVHSPIILSRIYLIRGKRVMLDTDIAELYGVTTKALNQAVKRNGGRFPTDFMFRLNKAEMAEVVTNCDHLRKLRFSYQRSSAFTQEGVAMLSGVLNSARAVQANILIMRTFAKLRELIVTNELIRQKIEELEKKYENHDKQFKAVFDAIRGLITPPSKSKREIGFHANP